MAKKLEKEFELVNRIIERHWNRAVGLANAESLMTYWTVGAFVSERLKKAQWGSKTVEALCDYLKMRNPKRKGYGKRNVYNMVEFYEAYSSLEFKSVSERLKLHEFVQMPSAQIQDTEVPGDKKGDGIVPLATIVQMPSAQSEYERRYLDSFPMFLTLTTFSNHLEILGRCNSIESLHHSRTSAGCRRTRPATEGALCSTAGQCRIRIGTNCCAATPKKMSLADRVARLLESALLRRAN